MLRNHPAFKSHGLLRTRDQKLLDQCDIVVDVGAVYDPSKKRFDHHQATFKETFSSILPEFGANFSIIRLSSAGLVYVHYGEEIISEILNGLNIKLSEKQIKCVFRKVYSALIQEIDAIDNGVPQFEGEPHYRVSTDLSSRVKNLNPDWMEQMTPLEVDKAFEEAVKYVEIEFLDKVKYFAFSWLPAKTIIEDAIQNRYNIHETGCIIEIKRFCPFKEHIFDIEREIGNVEIKFVIYKDTNTTFRIHAVPVNQGSFVSRKTLNKKWFGLRDEELENVSGINGSIFVHATGFTGGNRTREGAIKMAIKSLNAE